MIAAGCRAITYHLHLLCSALSAASSSVNVTGDGAAGIGRLASSLQVTDGWSAQ
jgi:hypothetical protein